MDIRNIAIIAHVDHGKTTLTNALLRATGAMAAGETMDTNALERERSITIYSKNASLVYKGVKINIVDTPGHADFGSEVERVLRSIDAVLLVVDAAEGPMPQTKFVLKKSLELGLRPIVVINKIDKPAARPSEVHDKVFELFMDLGASDQQLDFLTVYTDGKRGIAKLKPKDPSPDLTPLFDAIVSGVPPARSRTDLPLRMQPFNLAYDSFLGRLAIGRVYEGVIKTGQSVTVKKLEGESYGGKISKLYTFRGLKRQEVSSVEAGDIVIAAGLPEIYIGETVCENPQQAVLPTIAVDEPTIGLNFLVNNSPFAGREGKFVTSRQIQERLRRELEVNIGLKVDFTPSNFFKVYGRGELHIAILLENMRREGYELQVSKPEVVTREQDGQRFEPFEEVIVDVPEKLSGVAIEKMGKRRAKMNELKIQGSHARMVFEMPTRGLLGLRNEFMVDTKGEGILASRFVGFAPYAGDIGKRLAGSMVSQSNGKALSYALDNLQERGELYIKPGAEVYEGMVIGSVSKGVDLAVNPIKGKHLTNIRSAGEEGIQLKAIFPLTLERALEIVGEDEFVEVTPKSIRLRKQLLAETERVRARRQARKV